MSDPEEFEVLWPLTPSSGEKIDFSERLVDLNGKTIAELQDLPWGNWFPVIRAELKRRYPDLNIVEFDRFGFTHGPDEREVMAALPEALRTHKIDAVISGIGL